VSSLSPPPVRGTAQIMWAYPEYKGTDAVGSNARERTLLGCGRLEAAHILMLQVMRPSHSPMGLLEVKTNRLLPASSVQEILTSPASW